MLSEIRHSENSCSSLAIPRISRRARRFFYAIVEREDVSTATPTLTPGSLYFNKSKDVFQPVMPASLRNQQSKPNLTLYLFQKR